MKRKENATMMIFGFLFMLALIALPIALVVILLNKASNK